MRYIYEVEDKNYENFASGRVIYNQKGATAFPVRLASEVFLRSKGYLEDVKKSISIYDPCCGGAYLLTILGYLHGESISKIVASDIDKEMLSLAERNLGLLTDEGINKRIKELKKYINEYEKDSHKNALSSAIKLKSVQSNNKLEIQCFKADALLDNTHNFKVDLIITDLPYGNITQWSTSNEDNLIIFLNNMLDYLRPNSIVTIVTDKKQRVKHCKYNRIKHLTIGKRRISFLKPLKPCDIR